MELSLTDDGPALPATVVDCKTRSMSTTSALLFDPADPGLRRDPYPTYRRMREESPAWRSPTGVWYFTRYGICIDLLRSPALSYDSTATATYQASLSTDPEARARELVETQKNRSCSTSTRPSTPACGR